MATTVDFLPFATGAGANVESQAAYAADPSTSNGFSAGIASSAKFNKAMRQASFVAAALASWMSVEAGISVMDDGVLANFTSQITAALSAFGDNQGYLTSAQAQAAYAPLSAFSHSFGQSGYQKLPDGLILQWSFNTLLPNQTLSTVSFPIAFPNAAFGMIASAGSQLTLTTNQVGVGAAPISTSQAQIAVAANASGQTGVYYFALGN